jgi:hypothetical protein
MLRRRGFGIPNQLHHARRDHAAATVQLKYEPLSTKPWALFGQALAVIGLFGLRLREKDSRWRPRRADVVRR